MPSETPLFPFMPHNSNALFYRLWGHEHNVNRAGETWSPCMKTVFSLSVRTSTFQVRDMQLVSEDTIRQFNPYISIYISVHLVDNPSLSLILHVET